MARINALVANIDDKSGNKNGKPWRIVTLMLIEKAKERPKLKTPLYMQLGEDDMDLLEHDIEDSVIQVDVTEVKAGFREGEIEVRGTVVRQQAASQAPAPKPQPEQKKG